MKDDPRKGDVRVPMPDDDQEDTTGKALKSRRSPLQFETFVTVISTVLGLKKRPGGVNSQEAARVLKALLEDEETGRLQKIRRTGKRVKLVIEAIPLLVTIGCLVASLTSNNHGLRYKSYHGLRAWRWIVLVMETACGLTVIRTITFAIIWLITKHPTIRLYKYTVFFAWGMKTNFDVAVWLGLVFFSWLFWFKPHIKPLDWNPDDTAKALRYTTMTLLCLWLGAVFWLLKTLLILRLEAELHLYGSYGRIRRTILDLHGIRIIHNVGVWHFLKHTQKNVWMAIAKMKDGDDPIPVWILKRLVDLYLEDIENQPLDHDAAGDDWKLFEQAEGMLRTIVGKAQRKRHFIIPSDLDKYDLKKEELDHLFKQFGKKHEEKFGHCAPQTKATAEEHYQTLTPNPKQIWKKLASQKHEGLHIDHKTFLCWAVLAYKNCWGLKQTLESSKAAIIELDRLLSFIVMLTMSIIWLLVTSILSSSKLALLFSPFLASTFIFGNACQGVFDGLIFIFGMHPFHVGDRVAIDNIQMKVRKINLLTTMLFKYDTREVVVYPNSILASKSISNLEIAPDQGDSLDFTIDAETPTEEIADLENKIKKYFDDEPEYSAEAYVVQKEFQLGKGNEIKMGVYFKYLVSYLDSERRAVYKSKIIAAIKEFVREMNRRSKETTPPDHILVFTIDAEASLEKIKEVEAKIMERIGKYGNFEKSKLLMQENDGKEIKMAFHLKPSEVQEDHQQQDEIINPVETTDELITKIKLMIDEIIEQVLGSVFC
ncbi:hypothetical protein Ancab_031452 [Ancistrocladus abbreviatus]